MTNAEMKQFAEECKARVEKATAFVYRVSYGPVEFDDSFEIVDEDFPTQEMAEKRLEQVLHYECATINPWRKNDVPENARTDVPKLADMVLSLLEQVKHKQKCIDEVMTVIMHRYPIADLDDTLKALRKAQKGFEIK